MLYVSCARVSYGLKVRASDNEDLRSRLKAGFNVSGELMQIRCLAGF